MTQDTQQDSPLDKRSKEISYEGIEVATNNTATMSCLVFHTDTQSVAIYKHDIIRIDYGEETDDSIVISTRYHIVVLNGYNLDILFHALCLQSIFAVYETVDGDEKNCHVIAISIMDQSRGDE